VRETPGWTATSEVQLVRCHLREEQGPAPAMPAILRDAFAITAERAKEIEPLLDVRDLKVHFPIRKGLFKRQVGAVRAVDGVSLSIEPGKTLALVGESGCGKTTVGKAILQLLRSTAGSIWFEGVEWSALRGEALRKRRAEVQIVFQDPYASLNPRMRIGEILREGIQALGVLKTGKEIEARIAELLEQVGLPGEAVLRYPHEFSGGQRQRIAIARALAVNPKLIICDEPTSALDVSVQAQILNLLKQLQRDLGLSYLFITHNLSVVEYLADEVAVMYLGRIVERGRVEEVLENPAHPYTRALLAAVPTLDGTRATLSSSNDMPSPSNPPSGCHFHPRCPNCFEKCPQEYPPAFPITATQNTNCWLYELPAARVFAADAGEVKRALKKD
ncbi:MAG TPA: ABC transporter ATP-binding protein, partial [Burkholderiales bacterium]|nr:ABC transporter ATP-binding protein [Burkholderiales bacterium]